MTKPVVKSKRGRKPVQKFIVQIGGKQIKDVLVSDAFADYEKISLLETLFPRLSRDMIYLMSKYPDEISISGATLKLPMSWLDEE